MKAQDRWEMGVYACMALRSSVLAVGLADDTAMRKLPQFPESPLKDENTSNSGELTEEQIKAERERAKLFIMSL